MSPFYKKRTFFIWILIIALIVLSVFLFTISIPIVIAFITSLFLEPGVKLLTTKLNLKRNFSVLIVFLLFLAFVGATSYFLATKVVTEAVKIGENAPLYINEINKAWYKVEKNMVQASEELPKEFVNEISRNVEQFLFDMKRNFTEKVNFKNITTILTNIPNYLVSFLVYLIALFLFMIEIPNIKGRIYSHLTSTTADKVTFMISRLSYVVFGFIKAQFLVSIIIFIVSLIGLMLIAPEVALVMSIIIWVIDVIPIIGSIVILGPWALFQLITGDVALGTKLLILAAILLTIRRTVEPKVMGQHIGLSPLSTLISMYLGLKLFGILGFFIGPLVIIAFNTAREAGIIKLDFKI